MKQLWRRPLKSMQAGMFGIVYAISSPYLVPSLKASDPAINAELDSPPDKILLTFAAIPSAERSRIELFEGSRKIELGSVTEESNNMLSADIRSTLAPGRYRVHWSSVCLCNGGKGAQGDFEFSVR